MLTDEKVTQLRAACEQALVQSKGLPMEVFWHDLAAALGELETRRARAAARAASRPPRQAAPAEDGPGLGEFAPDGVLGELVDDADGFVLP